MSHGDRQTQRRAIVIVVVVGDEVVNAAARRVPSLTRRCRVAAVEQVNCCEIIALCMRRPRRISQSLSSSSSSSSKSTPLGVMDNACCSRLTAAG